MIDGPEKAGKKKKKKGAGGPKGAAVSPERIKRRESIALHGVTNHERGLEHGITLSFKSGDKAAIMGPNGVGKSSFMRMIADSFKPEGEERLEPDSGTIDLGNVWGVAEYVEQEPNYPEGLSFGDIITSSEGIDPHHVLDITRKLGLSLTENDLFAEIQTLSGGQQKAMQIALALVKEPSVLLLDEPENHLDIVSREKLIDVLREYDGMLIYVSHDRKVVNELSGDSRIISMEKGGTVASASNKTVEEIQLMQEQTRQNALADYGTEKRALEKLKQAVLLRQRIASRSTKGHGVYHKMKREYEERLAANRRPVTADNKPQFADVEVEKRKGKRVMSIANVNFSYGERPILRDASLNIVAGDRVLLLGRNGSGKSTLINLLEQRVGPDSGEVKRGENMRFAHLSQHGEFSSDDDQLTIFDYLDQKTDLKTNEIAPFLAKIQIKYDHARIHRLSTLSGGQKTKLRLALLFRMNPECIIVDEPTNHLDEDSWEVMAEALQEYKGTLLVVSHDEEFIDRLELNRFITIKDGRVQEHNYLSDSIEHISK